MCSARMPPRAAYHGFASVEDEQLESTFPSHLVRWLDSICGQHSSPLSCFSEYSSVNGIPTAFSAFSHEGAKHRRSTGMEPTGRALPTFLHPYKVHAADTAVVFATHQPRKYSDGRSLPRWKEGQERDYIYTSTLRIRSDLLHRASRRRTRFCRAAWLMWR